jgi:hypothetical protein
MFKTVPYLYISNYISSRSKITLSSEEHGLLREHKWEVIQYMTISLEDLIQRRYEQDASRVTRAI